MKIIKYFDRTLKEIALDQDIKENEVIRDFNISGEIGVSKIRKKTEFYCGPCTCDESVSDYIFINKYLESINKELKLPLELYIAENYHRFVGCDKKDAKKYLRVLKKRIKKDFEVKTITEY